MKSHQHALIGAVAAMTPDIFLAFFGWRKKWLPEDHPLVKAHRFLHSPTGLVWIITLAVASHIVVDWFSKHRSGPDER